MEACGSAHATQTARLPSLDPVGRANTRVRGGQARHCLAGRRTPAASVSTSTEVPLVALAGKHAHSPVAASRPSVEPPHGMQAEALLFGTLAVDGAALGPHAVQTGGGQPSRLEEEMVAHCAADVAYPGEHVHEVGPNSGAIGVQMPLVLAGLKPAPPHGWQDSDAASK